MSPGRENSFGEWLIPPTLGMKIMPTGPSRAISCASCPAPLGSSRVTSPNPRAASAMTPRTRGAVSAGAMASDSVSESATPPSPASRRHSARIRSWRRRIFASSRSRSSRPNTTRPGITL